MNVVVNEKFWDELMKNLPSYGTLNGKCINDAINLMLGVDHLGYRHILLKLNNLKEEIIDNKSRGLSIQGRMLKIGDMPETPYLDIQCNDINGHKVFNLIINEIFEKLRVGLDQRESVISTITKFRQFWHNGYRGIMTEEQIKGLFGELWFMLVWLIPKNLESVIGWIGPTRACHDFEFGNSAIEVKTTSSTRGHVHKINGLEQLQPPPEGELFLYSMRLKKENTALNSLPMLVEKIIDILREKPILLEIFERRLVEAGYFFEYTEDYAEYCFQITGERLYIVNDKFPKISFNDLKEGLPRGVEHVTYDINLEACSSCCLLTNPVDFKKLKFLS